jgi:hypothetical protein
MISLGDFSFSSNSFELYSWADHVPSLRRFLHEAGRIKLGKTSSQITVSQNVETAVEFFLDAQVRDLLERHVVESLVFCEALIPDSRLSDVLGLVALLFVLFALILFFESLFIFNCHADGVVHHALPVAQI